MQAARLFARHFAKSGVLFYGQAVEVYEGMVVGENARPVDLPINVCKKKYLTNERASHRPGRCPSTK